MINLPNVSLWLSGTRPISTWTFGPNRSSCWCATVTHGISNLNLVTSRNIDFSDTIQPRNQLKDEVPCSKVYMQLNYKVKIFVYDGLTGDTLASIMVSSCPWHYSIATFIYNGLFVSKSLCFLVSVTDALFLIDEKIQISIGDTSCLRSFNVIQQEPCPSTTTQ